MKATKVSYSRVFGLPNYENEKISIEIEVGEGEKAQDVLDLAKKFCNRNSVSRNVINEYERLKRIVDHPDDHTGRDVKEAREQLQKMGSDAGDELPF